MSDPSGDESFIVERIKADVVESLGRYFAPVRRDFEGDSVPDSEDDAVAQPDADRDDKPDFDFDFDEELGGYRRVASFGDDGVLTATTQDGRTFTIVRWELVGAHHQPVPSPIGDATMVDATGNPVTIEGLTIVEAAPDGYTIRRLVDWMPLYAQLGIIFPSRPVGMAQTRLVDPTDLMRERRERSRGLDPEAP